MAHLYRSPTSRLVAAAFVIASLAMGGYALLPAAVSTADAPLATKAAPSEALNQANTLSDAFRFSADHVLPAVVAIRNEVKPKLAKVEPRAPRGGRQLPKGLEGQLPRGFGELDPFLKRFFEEL